MLLKAKINILPYKKLMMICVLVILAICIASDLLVERFLQKQETSKNVELSQSIAKNILDTEKNIESFLAVSLKYVIKHATQNKITSNQELISLAKTLEVSSISIYDKDGRMQFTSRALDPTLIEHYKTFSIFDKTNCPDYKLMQNDTENIRILPFQWNPVRNISTKVVISWVPSLEQYFTCVMDDADIQRILQNSLNFYHNLTFLGFYTPSGQFLSYAGNNIRPINKTEHYKDNDVLVSQKDIIIDFSFGGLQKESCEPNGRRLTNTNNEYFYTLRTVFSKITLSKQILFLRLIFISIAILLTTAAYLTIQTFYNHKQYHESLKLQAEQVHHDIANPVQALDWGLKSILRNQKYDEKATLNLINQAQIIKGVIHDLYYLHDNNFDQKNIKSEPELLYPILESVAISSNSAAGTGRQIILNRPQDPFILTKINNSYLRRSLLNLVINAIQATKQNGIITIDLQEKNDQIVITIADNGIGINPQTLIKLNKGEKIDSKTGRGLGFFYAKKVIEHFGGKIQVESQQNQGTTQIITLPLLINKPIWFIDKIDTSKYINIVILDDDSGIQEIYKDIFKNNTLIHITKIQDFKDFLAKQDKNNFAKTLFIIDYSVDSITPTGIDLITKYSLQANAILITNMYLEQRVKDKCTELNIKLLPKSLLGFFGYSNDTNLIKTN